MEKGYFVSIEGPDGSGKTTQIGLLRDYVRERGYNAIFTREPGGTSIGEEIREIILDTNNGEMSGIAEALLYAASRAQHVHQVIKPALLRGELVICDRFMDSSIAYQGYGRKLGDDVRIINEIAVSGIMPDLTIFLDVNPEVGKSRIAGNSDVRGDMDRLELEEMEFHQRVYEGYGDLIERYRSRYVVVDGSGSIMDIQRQLREIVDEAIGEV